MNQDQTQGAAEVRPIEEVGGDAMGSLLQFALRTAKRRLGEPHALRILDDIEGGRARLHAAVDIGQNHTRIRCTLVPNNSPAEGYVVADMDLIRMQSTH